MINSVIKTFQTIELLLRLQESDLASLSKSLGFPKSTARRILKTLSSIGYVQQDPQTSRYRPSVKFFAWGRLMLGQVRLLEVARPFMEKLSESTGETVNLGVLDGLEVICVEKVASKQVLRQDQPIGERAFAYCTAFGKAQLAFMPDDKVTNLIQGEILKGSTKKSVKSTSALLQELRNIRERGYALDDEEYSKGVRCVGRPIFDHTSSVVAGISVAGPAIRMSPGRLPKLAKAVTKTAEMISISLGHSEQNRS